MASLRPDMAQLAEMLGVSVSTVSRALSGKPGVSDRTRRRVTQLAREVGYTVSPSASRLAKGRTNTVALIVTAPEQWYQSAAIARASAILHASGHDIALFNISAEDVRSRLLSGPGLAGRADGALVVSTSLLPHEEKALSESDIPAIGVGTVLDRFSFVTVDNEAEIATGVRYLLELQHTRIGLIQGSTPANGVNYVAQERGNGFHRAMGEHFDPALVIRAAGDDAESGASALAALLARPDSPTAVIAESDLLAAGAIQAARRMGLSVPDDLSVIGFDDSPIAELLELTTIRQDPATQAEHATRLLLETLSGPASPHDFTFQPCSLIVRHTAHVVSHGS
ncbi:LacI family transcriptional regulator [Microbacterium sp. Y-01]|uniref:LacI family DNA-binding transcriptional regulator n=1 Tax=Microbacterium sp. Y-01 TaxID=2048898 RepID=UPI000F5D9504|nr:LacI family DNA-binding transcriptional regulator [Microbacterium sp. Y-01]AZH79325.1 LacI family transcriptional regulator [Microbacterium sp. Y-01]